MVSRAVSKYVRIAPQKCQLVADLIRERYVGEALTILRFSKKKKASFIIEKVLRSAIANAQQKVSDIDVDNLFIAKIYINQGPQMKRFRAAPMGRALRIIKRTSHVHVYLEEIKGR
ncbi:MAG: 50S ribosomal protein L22 [Candidatus Aminicenantes bacterium]|nr:50S ribosomal protein L22 [Candidatus Aminicenantes bacterium]MBL7082118.1 50S ribosomal protein L22 [Candidatus Aminicenantes bacterium]